MARLTLSPNQFPPNSYYRFARDACAWGIGARAIIMGTAFGIYLGDDGAVAVRVDGSAKKPKLSRAAAMLWEPMPPAEEGKTHEAGVETKHRAAQLQQWLRKNRLWGSPVALCVDSSQVLFRDMRIAFTERRQIDKVITFQVEGLIPSTAIEDLSVGYTLLSTDKDGSRLLIAAAHKKPLVERLELLDRARMDARTADSTLGGALNLRALHPALNTVTERTTWIDLQGSRALIAVLDPDNIVSLRSMLIPRAASEEVAAAHRDNVVESGGPKTSAWTDGTDVSAGQLPVAGEETAPPVSETEEALAAITRDAEETVDYVVDGIVAPQPASRVDTEPLDGLAATPISDPVAAYESGIVTLQEPAPADAAAMPAPPSEELKAAALLAMLTRELRITLAGCGGGEIPVKRVVVSGVPERLQPALTGLEAPFGVERVEFIDLLAPLLPAKAKDEAEPPAPGVRVHSSKDKKEKTKAGKTPPMPSSPMLAPAVGVAIKLLGADTSQVNFRSGELAPGDAFTRIKSPLAVGVTLLFLLVGFSLMIVLKERAFYQDKRDMNIKKLNLPGIFRGAYEAAKDKPKYPGGETPLEELESVERKMSKEMKDKLSGAKSNYPPTYEADLIYAKVLEAIRDGAGKGGSPRDFSLVSLDVTQNNSSTKTDGKVVLTCWIDDEARSDRGQKGIKYLLQEALEAIVIESPLKDGKADSPRTIKLFEKVTYEAQSRKGSAESVLRGKEEVGGAEREVWVTKGLYTCVLTPLERKKPAKGEKAATN